VARIFIYVVLGLAVGAGGGWYVGYGLAERDALVRSSAAIEAALRAAELAVKSAETAAVEEQRRAVRAAHERTQRAKQADEVVANAKFDPDRTHCEWSDAERLRLERLYTLYGFSAGAGGVPDPVR